MSEAECDPEEDNVVPLNDGVLIKGIVSQRLIEHLEALLAQARRGEIVAIAYAWLPPTGRPHSNWCHTDAVHGWLLPSAVSVLQHRMLSDIMPDDD